MDIENVVIQGDISRADVRVLAELCTNKRVVEFGVGGSTLILSRCAASVTSYDTDISWINRTKHRIDIMHDKLIMPEFIHTTEVPNDIPECDVLFIDGFGPHRAEWTKHFLKCQIMIMHDSLGDTGKGPTLDDLLSRMFKIREIVESLDVMKYHYLDSNMVVAYKRQKPIQFINWNTVEDKNRIDPYS